MKQRTVAEKVSCTGVGLHGGAPVQVTLLPARSDSGIVFVRTDGPDPLEIPARPSAVVPAWRATTLRRGDVTIGRVEHLLAALYGQGIDNVRIEIDGAELPLMDGSAASFVYLIRSAGVFEQRAHRCALRLRRPIEVCDGDRRIRLSPSRGFQITYVVDLEHPAIGRQEYRLPSMDPDAFERELASARTFGFLNDAEALWSTGLGRGGSLQNTVVLDDRRVLNHEGLRWPNEFVRHKVLDLLGDLALLGVPIEGDICVERGGHALHHRLLAVLLENPDAWWIHDPDPKCMTRIHRIPAERAA